MLCKIFKTSFFFLTVILLTGAQAELRIEQKMQFSDPISPSERIMAIILGPPNRRPTDTKKCFVLLLDLETGKSIKALGTENVFWMGMSWRDQKLDELYMRTIDHNKKYVFSMVGVSEKGENIFRKDEGKKKVLSRSFR